MIYSNLKRGLELEDFKVGKLKQREKGVGWGAARKASILSGKIDFNIHGTATNLITSLLQALLLASPFSRGKNWPREVKEFALSYSGRKRWI